MLIVVPRAAADAFLPASAGATWTYSWADSVYSPTPTEEQMMVCSPKVLQLPCPTSPWSTAEASFVLGWQSVATSPYYAEPEYGNISFQDTSSGLLNTNWSSTPPPAQMPILCPTSTNCANSLSSSIYSVIWGSRDPVLLEPLYKGLSWSSTGGADNDVVSTSQFIGVQSVRVPAFKTAVAADVVRSEITQAGALGDPYGSGVRTIWWVRGVGPVKVIFEHAGGSAAPVTTVTLEATDLKALTPLPTADYFPLVKGKSLSYRFTNSRYMRKGEVEKLTDAAVENRSARFTLASVSGPMKVAGDYGFTVRLTGISPLFASVKAATLVTFPKLGHSRQFLSPYDLMTFGFGQVLPAYPQVGDTWKAGPGNQAFSVYGVRGTSKIIAIKTIRVPAGRFRALEVRSDITQKGHPFGSGVRYSWFAAGVGLVKLVFHHADHSISTVELLK